MSSRVECHSEYAYAERPVALWWQGQRREVEAVEAEWRTPEGRRFLVRASGGQRFELFYNEIEDVWRVSPA